VPVPLPEYSDKLPPVMLVPVPFGERKTMPTGVAEASPEPIIILPVETLAKEIVPEPLAFNVRFSFAPEERAERATPLPAAADFTLNPVAAEVVEASTLKVGFVVPAGPTAKALAEVDVIVTAPKDGVLDHDGAAPVLPIRTCPVVPAAVTPNALVVLPYKTPLAVNVVAPVPPPLTCNVPHVGCAALPPEINA